LIDSVCPGAYFAERCKHPTPFNSSTLILNNYYYHLLAIYITAARLVWSFIFSPTIDPKTKLPIWPDASIETGYTSGFNVRPVPFRCEIMVRDEKIGEVLEREGVEAREELRVFE